MAADPLADRQWPTSAHRHERCERLGGGRAVRRTAGLVVAALAMVAALSVGACTSAGTGATAATSAGPSAAGEPTARTEPALTRIFTSSIHGYSVRYAEGWSATPGTLLDGASDAIEHATDVRFLGASEPMPAKLAGMAWLQEYYDAAVAGLSEHARQAIGTPDTWQPVRVGDTTGYLLGEFYQAATSSAHYVALAQAGGRQYTFESERGSDRDLFLAMLATVTLDPGAAVDPSADPSPSSAPSP